MSLVGCDQNDKNAYNTSGNATKQPSDMRTDRTVDRTADRTVDRTDNTVDRTVDRTGDAAKSASDKIAGVIPTSEGQAHATIAEITSAALTRNGIKDIVERLAKNDRDRLADWAKTANMDDYNAKVDLLRGDWKSKYTDDFDKPKTSIFQNFVTFSEVKKEGFNTGTITLPASHGLPELTFNLESSGVSWKLDIPDEVSGEQLKSNLMKHFDMLDADKANWPADKVEADRLFAHHVLAALAGK